MNIALILAQVRSKILSLDSRIGSGLSLSAWRRENVKICSTFGQAVPSFRLVLTLTSQLRVSPFVLRMIRDCRRPIPVSHVSTSLFIPARPYWRLGYSPPSKQRRLALFDLFWFGKSTIQLKFNCQRNYL